MALSNLTNRVTFTGTGAALTLAFTFKIFDEEDLLVTVADTDGVETQLTLNTDYSVSAPGLTNGGTITLIDAAQAWLTTSGYLKTSYTLAISRHPSFTQRAKLGNQSSYAPESIETQLDRLTMFAQSLKQKANTALRLQETDDHSTDMKLPSKANRASNFLAFDANGKPVASSGVTSTALTLPGSAGMAAFDGVSTLIARTITAGSGISVTDGTGAAGNPTIALNINGLTAATTSETEPKNKVPVYISASNKQLTLPRFATALNLPALLANIAIRNATTTNSNDSIKITGNFDALSSTNPGAIGKSSNGNPGKWEEVELTADVTINLTGAHWGAGTKGDLVDAVLYVYHLNTTVANNVAWAISPKPDLKFINGTNATATPTSVTTAAGILVNSMANISGGTTYEVTRIGYFQANFDDTGGAAEDLWTVSTNHDDIATGLFEEPGRSEIVLKNGNGHGSTNTKIRRWTTVESNVGSGMTLYQTADEGDRIVINESGLYSMVYTDSRAASYYLAGISRNSNQLTTTIASITAAHALAASNSGGAGYIGICSVSTWLDMGDIIRAHSDGTPDGTGTTTTLRIAKLA